MTFCDLTDEVTVTEQSGFSEAGQAFSFTCDGPYAAEIDPSDNLCLRAAEKLAEALGPRNGAHIHLQKNIPVAAGLGGGSADAAATLRALMMFWERSIPEEDLSALALSLGAEVPVCLAQRPMWVRGIGDILEPCVLPALPLVLVNPHKTCLTKEVFQAFDKTGSDRDKNGISPKRHPEATPKDLEPFSGLKTAEDLLAFLCRDTSNQLTVPAVGLVPEISDVLNALTEQKACHLVRMSGSGASCFGVCATSLAAEEVARRLKQDHPEWLILATRSYAGAV